MLEFRWNAWNLGHIAEHGVTAGEAQYVADRPRRPYPRMIGGGKWLVIGRSAVGRCLQVIYVDDEDSAPYTSFTLATWPIQKNADIGAQ